MFNYYDYQGVKRIRMDAKPLVLVVIICFVLLLTSCQTYDKVEDSEIDSWSFELDIDDLYGSVLKDVSEVEIMDGRNGTRAVLTDESIIEDIVTALYDVSFQLDDSQEAKTGWLYSVKLVGSDGNWFEVVKDGSVSDNFRIKNKISRSPYYVIRNDSVLYEIVLRGLSK